MDNIMRRAQRIAQARLALEKHDLRPLVHQLRNHLEENEQEENELKDADVAAVMLGEIQTYAQGINNANLPYFVLDFIGYYDVFDAVAGVVNTSDPDVAAVVATAVTIRGYIYTKLELVANAPLSSVIE